MMDAKYIEALLEKYWNAETTQNEESIIKAYMVSDHVAEDLLYAVPLFKNVSIDQSNIDLDTKIISKLLDKYFEGQSSIEEEALLKEYFDQENVSPGLRQYKSLFNAFSRASKVEYGKELVLPKESKIIPIHQQTKVKTIPLLWLKVASAAIFVGVIGYFLIRNNIADTLSTPQIAGTAKHIEPETPEEALQMTMHALAMVSKNYKKGQENLLEGMKTMNETNIMKE
jgi:hypothetical protein